MSGQLLNALRGGCYGICLAIMTSTMVWAQENVAARNAAPQPEPGVLEEISLPEVSEITLGAGYQYAPDYIGSNNYKFTPKLALFLRFKDVLTLDDDGVALNILGMSEFEFGPVLHVTEGRKEDVNSVVNGLGDVQRSLDFGVFAQITFADRFIGRLRYFTDVIGGDNGEVLELSVKTSLYEQKDFTLSVKLSSDLVTKKRAMRFFGVTAEQAAMSGLPRHEVKGGLQDVRAELKAHWAFSEHWALVGYTRYARLLGGMARSPIVDPRGSPHQFIIGSYATYTFEFN